MPRFLKVFAADRNYLHSGGWKVIIVSVYVHIKIRRTVNIELDNKIIKIYLQSLVGIVMSCPFTTKNNKLKMIKAKFIFLDVDDYFCGSFNPPYLFIVVLSELTQI